MWSVQIGYQSVSNIFLAAPVVEAADDPPASHIWPVHPSPTVLSDNCWVYRAHLPLGIAFSQWELPGPEMPRTSPSSPVHTLMHPVTGKHGCKCPVPLPQDEMTMLLFIRQSSHPQSPEMGRGCQLNHIFAQLLPSSP